MLRLLVLLSFAILFRCGDDDENPIIDVGPLDAVPGIGYLATPGQNADSVAMRLATALAGNSDVAVVARVDHQANADRAGLSLGSTELFIFGNPSLGTPLLEINPLIGLELPQKMLVYEADGEVVVAYNSPGYLVQRYGVGAAGTLNNISNALGGLLATAVNTPDVRIRITTATNTLAQGIVTLTDSGSVDSVYTRLRTAITDNPNLGIVAEVDHRANAAGVGTTIPANRLLVFGNPALGTPLMQAQRSVALDLPQKMLVYESAPGEVTVAYNDPLYLAARHGIPQTTAELTTIQTALANLAAAAL